jgi:hypothetical protein
LVINFAWESFAGNESDRAPAVIIDPKGIDRMLNQATDHRKRDNQHRARGDDV